eukprot:1576187-Pyramimonas_sp.AAC.1
MRANGTFRRVGRNLRHSTEAYSVDADCYQGAACFAGLAPQAREAAEKEAEMQMMNEDFQKSLSKNNGAIGQLKEELYAKNQQVR